MHSLLLSPPVVRALWLLWPVPQACFVTPLIVWNLDQRACDTGRYFSASGSHQLASYTPKALWLLFCHRFFLCLVCVHYTIPRSLFPGVLTLTIPSFWTIISFLYLTAYLAALVTFLQPQYHEAVALWKVTAEDLRHLQHVKTQTATTLFPGTGWHLVVNTTLFDHRFREPRVLKVSLSALEKEIRRRRMGPPSSDAMVALLQDKLEVAGYVVRLVWDVTLSGMLSGVRPVFSPPQHAFQAQSEYSASFRPSRRLTVST